MGGNIMILWTTRLEEFKSKVTEYIKDKVDEKGKIEILLNGAEYPMVIQQSPLGDYLISSTKTSKGGSGTECYNIDNLDVELVVQIADKIHLKPVTNEDGSIKTPFQE